MRRKKQIAQTTEIEVIQPAYNADVSTVGPDELIVWPPYRRLNEAEVNIIAMCGAQQLHLEGEIFLDRLVSLLGWYKYPGGNEAAMAMYYDEQSEFWTHYRVGRYQYEFNVMVGNMNLAQDGSIPHQREIEMSTQLMINAT